MKPTIGCLLLSGALFLAGCQGPAANEGATRAPFRLNPARSVEITPADDEFDQHRVEAGSTGRHRKRQDSAAPAEMTEGELYALPKFTVTRKGFLNFGLSVVTNTEVTLGGKIEWMRVGVVLPGSPAAHQGLFTGIEILAIDDRPVAELTREDMLHALFERESGEQVRLLVYSRQFGPLPRFITLRGGSGLLR
jgi:hypothetical protein